MEAVTGEQVTVNRRGLGYDTSLLEDLSRGRSHVAKPLEINSCSYVNMYVCMCGRTAVEISMLVRSTNKHKNINNTKNLIHLATHSYIVLNF